MDFTFRQYLGAGALVFLGVLALVAFFNTMMFVDAGEIVVIQSFTGDLRVVSDPGPTMLMWGTPTHYPRRQQLEFRCAGARDALGKCSGRDTAIQVRFSDGGHAMVSGVVSWEMPLAAPAVIALHRAFRGIDAIDTQLVQPAVTKAFYQTAPLMSSTESYASRRTEFLQLFEDQLKNGTYKTRTVSVTEPDPITGMDHKVNKVELVMDTKDQPERAEASAFSLYSMSILPATITAMDYDPEVEKQIGAQRDAVLAVQSAQANAKKAEQDAITAQQHGLALAAQARAEGEAQKATEVTSAEKTRDVAVLAAQQERDVAKLNQEAAEFTKQTNILLGQGEAERKKLVMSADGALEQKLAAYVRVQEAYADAVARHQGSWVPSVVMAGSSANTANGAQQLMEMFATKAARDLALDMSLPASGTTRAASR